MEAITLAPRRLLLTGDVGAVPVTRWRGVWGMALKECCPAAYAAVFEGIVEGAPARPAYVLREVPSPVPGRRTLSWTLIGREAIAHEAALMEAWALAGRQGVGRGRSAFRVAQRQPLGPDGAPAARGMASWPLSRASWPLPGDPQCTPCRVSFPAGIHLRYSNRFLDAPTWPDLLHAMYKRALGWLPEDAQATLAAAWPEWERAALARPAQVETAPLTLPAVWSGRQERERVYLAVAGRADLPAGPGPAWPVLLAAQWLHVGRHTTEGLGGVQACAAIALKSNGLSGDSPDKSRAPADGAITLTHTCCCPNLGSGNNRQPVI
ncbi:MAG: CRISPR system precrRNA processing endoribonuclease RAMP protein Cas6 [Candidatus Hydrogenedentes bacterium]|nr:CRISPR system precrRNA processing endoribonuclease RAMP protein Cas6 [Candidatus Hydrogenedentota bacterium]